VNIQLSNFSEGQKGHNDENNCISLFYSLLKYTEKDVYNSLNFGKRSFFNLLMLIPISSAAIEKHFQVIPRQLCCEVVYFGNLTQRH